MKNIIVVMTILCSFAASALTERTYEVTCWLKDDFDDWNVYISLDAAVFWDNDTNTELEYYTVTGENYLFSTSNDYGSTTFFFNQSSMEGELITRSYDDGKSFKYDFYCGYKTETF